MTHLRINLKTISVHLGPDLQSLDFVINRFFMKLFITKSIATVKYCQEMGWTVIRLRHPDPAGFPLTGEICLRPDCMWQGGSDFQELQYPVLQ